MFDKITIRGAAATPTMWQDLQAKLPKYNAYTPAQQEELQVIYCGLKGLRGAGLGDAYRAADAWANSDLGAVRDHLQGVANSPKPYAAFAFGQLFHGVALGQLPPESAYLLSPAMHVNFDEMLKAYTPHHITAAAHNPVMYEVPGFRTVRGVPMKAKADIWQPVEKVITDLKTTSCYSEEDFRRAIDRYEYHRQAAHYCDVFGATKFRFIAIQKRRPFAVWVVEMGSRSKVVEEGRQQYRFLLDKAVNQIGASLPSEFYAL